MERRSKRGAELKNRETNDVDHQRGTAAVTIGQESEQERANGTHGQRKEICLQDDRNLGVEIRCEGADAEDQDEEIECVERPAEKAGDESIALSGGETAKGTEEVHGWP